MSVLIEEKLENGEMYRGGNPNLLNLRGTDVIVTQRPLTVRVCGADLGAVRILPCVGAAFQAPWPRSLPSSRGCAEPIPRAFLAPRQGLQAFGSHAGPFRGLFFAGSVPGRVIAEEHVSAYLLLIPLS